MTSRKQRIVRDADSEALAEIGDGNVFADLELPDPDEEAVKAKIVRKIQKVIDERGLTQKQAGDIIGLPQSGSRSPRCRLQPDPPARPTCSPRCCLLHRQRVPQPGPPGQTLPCRGHRRRGPLSHVTPDRQAPRPSFITRVLRTVVSIASPHKGFKAMWPAVRFRRIDFPTAFRAAQAA